MRNRWGGRSLGRGGYAQNPRVRVGGRWLLVPGAVGSFFAIGILRNPELVERPGRGPDVDEIIAHGGLSVSHGPAEPTSIEVRLTVLEALDAVRLRLGPPRRRVLAPGVALVGGVGWLAGAVASIVIGNDAAAAGICIATAGACGAGAWWMTRIFGRLETAERVLEGQLRKLPRDPPVDRHPGEIGQGKG